MPERFLTKFLFYHKNKAFAIHMLFGASKKYMGQNMAIKFRFNERPEKISLYFVLRWRTKTY